MTQPFDIEAMRRARTAAMEAEILRLTAEVERLREALVPFAEAADECDEYGLDDSLQAPVDAGACREARAALGETP